MLLDLALFAAGLAALYFGSEWLVTGAARLATSLGVQPFVVGLTVVAFGTSAPELLVSGLASWERSGSIAVGNVIGSNIANVALILGVAALIQPIRVKKGLIVRDVPIMIGFAGLFLLFAWNGAVSRLEGVLVLALFAGYMVHVARDAAAEPRVPDEVPGTDAEVSRGRSILLTVGGLVALVGGAQLLITGAVSLARGLGVPEVVIGLTLVAFGTSVPELAASIAASRRGEAQLVMGNVIGSNIFNGSLILGVAALIRPLPVGPDVLRYDIPVMILVSLLLVPFVFNGLRLNRWEGGVLLASYLAFVVVTVL